jgi:CO/xanthine dehydrogenase FAD-binding subunit
VRRARPIHTARHWIETKKQMRPLDCVVARDAQHALELLARYAPAARPIAGGTDLLVELRCGRRDTEVLVDLTRAADLKRIELTAEGLAIGAAATHTEVMRSPLVREFCPVLAEAAHAVGAVQTRNLGTIGGNLASAVPSMDIGPALLALDAQITVAGPKGRRRVAPGALFTGPRRTVLECDELLIEVIVPRASFGKPMSFLKLGLRKGQALALVNVSAGFHLTPDDSVARDARIALGAVAPTIVRAEAAERFLEGRALRIEALAEAGRIASAEVRPITDFRASAQYRRDLVGVLTRRALEAALAQVRERRAPES